MWTTEYKLKGNKHILQKEGKVLYLFSDLGNRLFKTVFCYETVASGEAHFTVSTTLLEASSRPDAHSPGGIPLVSPFATSFVYPGGNTGLPSVRAGTTWARLA